MPPEKQDDIGSVDEDTVSVARSIQNADRRFLQPGEIPLQWDECLEMAKERLATRT
ncbi:MAG: hypothetical protein ACYCOX_17935 [Acidobacteriaceae bacterium]